MSDMEKMNIPINKGNYSLDTEEREKAFEFHRGYGWENEYLQYRINWEKCAKEKIILDYPLLVDIELSTVCNLHCPMCYTITDAFARNVKKGFMDFDLYKKIIDEIKGRVPAIRLSLRGESTLDPDFIKCILYAKQSGIREVATLTNASKLEPEFFERMMLAGMDWITISLDGIKEEYERIRKPLMFEDTLRKIKEIKRIKKEYDAHRPVVKIQAIWPAIREHAEEFYNIFSPFVDLIAFNPLIDYLDSDTEIIYDQEFSCPQHYQRLVIGVDGKVMPCSNDEMSRVCVGDVNQQTVHEIWHGEELQKIRDGHKKHLGFLDMPLCKLCYLPRETVANERVNVNGREIIIRNYIGRNQIIGR